MVGRVPGGPPIPSFYLVRASPLNGVVIGAPLAGLEPTTFAFEARCSVR